MKIPLVPPRRPPTSSKLVYEFGVCEISSSFRYNNVRRFVSRQVDQVCLFNLPRFHHLSTLLPISGISCFISSFLQPYGPGSAWPDRSRLLPQPYRSYVEPEKDLKNSKYLAICPYSTFTIRPTKYFNFSVSHFSSSRCRKVAMQRVPQVLQEPRLALFDQVESL